MPYGAGREELEKSTGGKAGVETIEVGEKYRLVQQGCLITSRAIGIVHTSHASFVLSHHRAFHKS